MRGSGNFSVLGSGLGVLFASLGGNASLDLRRKNGEELESSYGLSRGQDVMRMI